MSNDILESFRWPVPKPDLSIRMDPNQAVTIASISVAHAGYMGVVIVRGEGIEFELVHALSTELGHLERLAERTDEGKDKQRVISNEEMSAALGLLEADLRSHDVQKVILEQPSAKSVLGSAVFGYIHEHVQSLGVEIEPVHSAWRYRFGRSFEYRTGCKLLAAKVFGDSALESLAYDSTLFAGALAAHVILIEVDPPITAAQRRKLEREAHRQRIQQQSPPETAEAFEELSPDDLQELAPAPPPAEADPYAGLPVIAGFDSGAMYAGICIAQGNATPLKFLHFDTFELEREVPLKKPRKVTMNGKSEVLTTKRVCSLETVSHVAEQVMQTLLAYKVTHLVIEYTEHVHIDASQANGAAARAIATNLIHTSWLVVMVAERARAAGIHVELVQAATWRAKVAGRLAGKQGGEGVARKGTGSVDLLRRAISTGFAGWPEGVLHGRYRVGDGNEHERDAGGLVLYEVILLNPPEDAPRKRLRNHTGASAGKPPRKPKPNELARRAEEQKRRDAVGCKCTPGKRHLRTCKLYKGESNKLLEYQP